MPGPQPTVISLLRSIRRGGIHPSRALPAAANGHGGQRAGRPTTPLKNPCVGRGSLTPPKPTAIPHFPIAPRRGRARPARALPKASTPILNNSPSQPPRPHQLSARAGISPALKTPRRGVFAPRYAGRGARAFRFPHGSPFTPDTY